MIGMSKTVYVGLSGGVDSSVTALLLKEQGYRVVGAHMKNWSRDIAGFECPWQDDYQEARRLAAFLDIEFELFDFEDQYHDKVVDYMINEFKSGRTPNPDVMCNQEIKFKLFLDKSLERGADYIATGHYARSNGSRLLQAKDADKDQTYFLYRIDGVAVAKTIFPLGDIHKDEVRVAARKAKLPNAERKESMGICFVGKVGIKDFLKEYIEAVPGNIVEDGQAIGQHEGAVFYTIGQRQGLGLGGGLPYYVIGKDMEKNEVYVTRDLNSKDLWTSELQLSMMHFINQPPQQGQELLIRTRHRAPLIKAIYSAGQDGFCSLQLEQPVRAATPGQSAVLYAGQEVLGGGLVY